jgi:hypothetical protein
MLEGDGQMNDLSTVRSGVLTASEVSTKRQKRRLEIFLTEIAKIENLPFLILVMLCLLSLLSRLWLTL